MTLTVGTLLLAAFGSRELLDIDISTLVRPVFLLSLPCSCICNDDIKYEHAHNRHTVGRGEREIM